MRKIQVFNLVVIIVVGTAFTACQPPPDFPDVPKINFLEIKELDSANIGVVIEFEDGDADMGLTTTQINPPYNEYNYITNNNDTIPPPKIGVIVDSVKNLYFSNAILKTFVKRNGIYIEAYYGINFQTGDTIDRPDLRFPPVTQKVQNQPVSGTIEILISTRFFPWTPQDTLQFEIYVIDRALHKSNKVKTSGFNIQN